MTDNRQSPARSKTRFRSEIVDFWRFIRHPHPVSRLPGRAASSGLVADWWPGITPGRLFAWAALLWAVNLFALGPVAVAAAGMAGVTHRLDPANIPWLTAVLWAPLVEEMLFRYGLRRPRQALWLIPAMLPVVLWGPKLWTGLLLAAFVILACWGARHRAEPLKGWDTNWRRYYLNHYGWVFHLVALTFAAVHLTNFVYGKVPYWLLPLLVLPQWLTGLVLGWMRVRRGIGAAMLLHATFNAGPILMIWAIMRWVPAAAS
ncbi:CPBP family glutamic-type intramembrane protease [Achromobacter seleniivolatilans]|uniref:CPBP family glutamic-type intramembrane protease n=1 Tax=Achromobacter seleniivolatilans TaxID=3047478 RepID=A0ABY9M0Q0_9BURK|nr:CPBP family glutamic-type intramembrane protease [Achromobacter sp. R39]WMD20134.1 CPBP family glutamic-type intramembrane protease [Achromobacter sp. R39]